MSSQLASGSASSNTALVEQIVSTIASYLHRATKGDQFDATGRDALRLTVSHYVTSHEHMELVFPGFPFKSPSTRKVLGQLPDRCEELLLKRLNALACDIECIYPPGASIRIVSDGVVYGELLGQSDASVWCYNDGLRKMTEEYGLKNISFVRVVDLLDASPQAKLNFKVMHQDEYVDSIPGVRSKFLAHQIPGYNLEQSLKADSGTLWTYRGYLRFLESDLEGSPVMMGMDGRSLSGKAQDKKRRIIAKQMLNNGASFSDLVARRFPDAVRLSVHAHNNAGPKFAFELFPGHDMCASPWHNVIFEKLDGRLVIGHHKSFNPSTYDVVMKDGVPYYLLERDNGCAVA